MKRYLGTKKNLNEKWTKKAQRIQLNEKISQNNIWNDTFQTKGRKKYYLIAEEYRYNGEKYKELHGFELNCKPQWVAVV